METKSRDSCPVCTNLAPLVCTNCRQVHYCSKQHQKKDWKNHKTSCFPLKVQLNSVVGRYHEATRKIKEGDLILRENPIFSGPNGKNLHLELCLGCNRVCNKSETIQCQKCNWYLHINCRNSPIHCENECDIFANMDISPTSRPESGIYLKIVILRGCLLKSKCPAKWEQLQGLQSTSDSTHIDPRLSEAVSAFILHRCNLNAQGFTKEHVDHVLGCVAVNGFVSQDNYPQSVSYCCGTFVYLKGSMFSHDCSPNLKWTIQDNGELKLWALRDIEEGGPLTHSYTWNGVGSNERRMQLWTSKFFICRCKRCQDPREFGSYFSAIKCGNCATGYIISDRNDDNKTALTDGESGWKCERNCPNQDGKEGITMTGDDVDHLVQNCRQLFENCCKSPADSETESDLRETVIRKCCNLRENLLKKVHPNHFVILEIEQKLMGRISNLLFNKTLPTCGTGMKLEEKLELANILITFSKKCLKVWNLISPGITAHAGKQCYYLQMGIGVMVKNQSIEKRFTGSKSFHDSSEEDVKLKKEWKQVRERGAMMLQMEYPGRLEWLLAQAMSQDTSVAF